MGNTGTIKVYVEVPNNAQEGAYLNLSVIAWSEADRMDAVSIIVDTVVKGVYRLSLSANPTLVTAYPGSKPLVPITAANTGNLGGPVTFSIVDPDPALQDVSIAPTSMNIPKFTSTTISLTATIPQDIEDGDYQVTVRGILAGEATALLTITFSTSGPLVDMMLESDAVQTAVYSDAQGSYSPLTFDFRIYNNATPTTNIDFFKSGNASTWASDIPPVIGINETHSDNGKLIGVPVNVPSNAQAGTYYLLIKALSTTNPDAYDELNLTIIVPARYEVHIAVQGSDTINTEPEEKKVALLRVENRGNTPDIVDLNHDLGPGWQAGFEDLSGEPITYVSLQARPDTHYAMVNFVFNASMDIEADDILVQLTAASRSDPAKLHIDTLTIELSVIYGIKVTDIKTRTSFNPENDDEAEFSFRVENTGNSDQTIRLSSKIYNVQGQELSDVEKARWTLEYKVNDLPVPAQVNIPQGDVRNFTMDITPPIGARAGEYRVEITATIYGTTRTDSVNLYLDVVKVHDMTISLDKTKISIAPRSSETITLSIRNDGNGNERVYITFQPGQGGGSADWFSSVRDVSVDPGETSSVRIRITVPEGTPAGTYVFTVRTNSTGSTPLTETLTVEVTGPRGALFGLTLFEWLIVIIVIVVVALMVHAARKNRGPEKEKAPGEEMPEKPVANSDTRMSM